MSLYIRKATAADADEIFALIKELAAFEKAPQEVDNSPEQIRKDGFGENPLFTCFLAELDDKIIGMALYYFRYSTWKGKRLYLEDIIVKEAFRGIGAGKMLFEEMLAETLRMNCNGMSFQVLEWNEPAILFYKKFGASFDEEWTNVSLSNKQIAEINQLQSNKNY